MPGASARRWTIPAIVMAGHIAAVGLVCYGWRARQGRQIEQPMEVVLLIASDPQPIAPRADERTTGRPLTRRTAPPAQRALSAEEPPSHAVGDWDTQARVAADEVMRQAREQRRSFGHALSTPPAAPKPGVFGAQSENRRAGRVEGGTRFWVTDDCYFEFPPGPPEPALAGGFRLRTTECKPPPSGGGENLFEDLTPKYLRRLPGAPRSN